MYNRFMPKPLRYKAGSLIYARGETADKIFILQNGIVSLVYEDMETGEDQRDQVQPGEFFGVKSALGRYPREENAITAADSGLMAFTVQEFETLALSNTRIIMKMLKVFSNQMRRIHTQVSKLTEPEEIKPDEGLYGIGEKYLKRKRYSYAKYIFSRYIALYPAGKRAAQAAKNLQIAQTALAEEEKNRESGGIFDVTKAFRDAGSLVAREKYKEAIQLFIKIIDSGENEELSAKSFFEVGRCLFLLNRFEDCVKHYTELFERYPNHPDVTDVMFYMGRSLEKTGDKEQAAQWYRKIIAMPESETDKTRTMTMRALEGLEG